MIGPGDFFRKQFGAQRGWLDIATIPIGGGAPKDHLFAYPDGLDRAVAFVMKVREHANVYFCVNLLVDKNFRIKVGEKEKGPRVNENVSQATTVWADLDKCEPSKLHVPPTYVVRTSADRYQAVWVLEDVVPIDVAAQCSRDIAYYHRSDGADVSGWDRVQLLRVPDTINHKYDDKPAVMVVGEGRTGFAVADFAAYAGASASVRFDDVDADDLELPDPVDADSLDPWWEWVRDEPIEKGKRSDRSMHVVYRGIELGRPWGEIRCALRLHPPTLDSIAEKGWPWFLGREPKMFAEAIDKVTASEREFWSSREVLTHIRAFARARLASPWAVLGSVLARVIAATPPNVVLPPLVGDEVSLNLFVGLVGPSGSGKDAALRAARAAVDVGDVQVEGPGSGEGIGHLFMRRLKDGTLEQHTVSVLFAVPEIDTLTALGSRKGATLLPELRKAFMGDTLGFAYADPTKKLPVAEHSYRLCLVAGIQPTRGKALLDDADAGTPQRFLWLPSTDPGAPDEVGEAPSVREWERPIEWSRPESVGRHTVVDVCDMAVRTIRVASRERLRGSVGKGLDGHALLVRLKVATAFGLLEGRATVEQEDWELAGALMLVSDRTREAMGRALAAVEERADKKRGDRQAKLAVQVATAVEDSQTQRVSRALFRKLPELGSDGGEWMAGSKWKKTLSSTDRRLFDDAVALLVGSGQVDPEEIAGTGEPGMRYRRHR